MYLIIYGVLQFIKHVIFEDHFFYLELNFMATINEIVYFVRFFITAWVKRYQYQFMYNVVKLILNLQIFALKIRNQIFSKFNPSLNIY